MTAAKVHDNETLGIALQFAYPNLLGQLLEHVILPSHLYILLVVAIDHVENVVDGGLGVDRDGVLLSVASAIPSVAGVDHLESELIGSRGRGADV